MSSLKAFISKQRREVGPHRQLSAKGCQRLERRNAPASLSPSLPRVPPARSDSAAASSAAFEKRARFTAGRPTSERGIVRRAFLANASGFHESEAWRFYHLPSLRSLE